MTTIAFYLFLLCLFLQIAFWLFVFARLAFAKKAAKTTLPKANFPISVIICGHNEGDNFQTFLPQILNQNYPNFEILVVNDRSTDNSANILDAFEKQYKQLRVIHLTDFERTKVSKKHALAIGIRAAKNEILLMTDADSAPNSVFWIQSMANKLSDNKSIVLGYVMFHQRETWIHKFIRYDKLNVAIQYLSFGLMGLPYMGAGPNLMYRKSLFIQADGFKKHEHIASGDDDLFISEVSNAKNTVVNLAENSFIYCEPKATFKQFYRQKSRHISTSWHYKWQHQLLLGVFAQSHFWLYIFGIISLFNTNFLPFLLIGMIVRWLIMLFIYNKITARLNEKPIFLSLPILDILYVFYYLIFAFPLIKGNGNRWE